MLISNIASLIAWLSLSSKTVIKRLLVGRKVKGHQHVWAVVYGSWFCFSPKQNILSCTFYFLVNVGKDTCDTKWKWSWYLMSLTPPKSHISVIKLTLWERFLLRLARLVHRVTASWLEGQTAVTCCRKCASGRFFWFTSRLRLSGCQAPATWSVIL